MANEIHKQFINMNYHKNVKMIRRKCHHSAAWLVSLKKKKQINKAPLKGESWALWLWGRGMVGHSDLYKVFVGGANVAPRSIFYYIFFFCIFCSSAEGVCVTRQ